MLLSGQNVATAEIVMFQKGIVCAKCGNIRRQTPYPPLQTSARVLYVVPVHYLCHDKVLHVLDNCEVVSDLEVPLRRCPVLVRRGFGESNLRGKPHRNSDSPLNGRFHCA